MKYPLTKQQRQQYADKIMDWGNLVFVGLTITQAFDNLPYALARFVIGSGVFAGAYTIAYLLTRKGGEQ